MATRVCTWFAASILVFIALAIAVYVPISVFGAPADRDSWTAGFYTQLSIAMFLHLLIAFGAWLWLARRFDVPRMLAIGISGVAITIMGYMAVGLMLFGFE